jgi:hypothetical protein
MKTKIEHLEEQFAQKLENPVKSTLQEHYSIPPGYRLRVSLLDADGRKKRSNAAADNWLPVSGRLEIRLEPALPVQNEAVESGRTVSPISSERVKKSDRNIPAPNVYVHPAAADSLEVLASAEGEKVADLLRALDRAESKPGWSFVPLKKFRDEILPSEHIPSMRTDVEQRRVLGSAIEKRLILVGKVLNPKSPQFPVTTIRVNRMMPEVREILGGGGEADLDFHPVEIKGEPLSATVIRERRR